MKKHSRAKRVGEFHHHMAKARVWLNQARTFRGSRLAHDLMVKASSDRAIAFAWLRGAA